MFRNAPIKAGFCPFCLGNKKLCPSKRMVQFFISPPEWHTHVEAHLSQLNGSFRCEHPACLLDFGSTEELTYHLIDTHCWRPRRESPKKKRKFELEDGF
jgi:carbonic anhydrase